MFQHVGQFFRASEYSRVMGAAASSDAPSSQNAYQTSPSARIQVAPRPSANNVVNDAPPPLPIPVVTSSSSKPASGVHALMNVLHGHARGL